MHGNAFQAAFCGKGSFFAGFNPSATLRQPETLSIPSKNRLAQHQAVLFSGCLFD
ncbi:hypothetical protein [Kingella oralis]|uniref:hypothetical protein n=1 Tax=Kingella oralis TaxID=505 RepID=UPI0028E471F9|nr:hypothetical protein [Kingella oralis]